MIPADRSGYLLDIIQTVQEYHKNVQRHSEKVADVESLDRSAQLVEEDQSQPLREMARSLEEELPTEIRRLLDQWSEMKEAYSGSELVFKIRDRRFETPCMLKLWQEHVPQFLCPKSKDVEIHRWLMLRKTSMGISPIGRSFPFRRRDASKGCLPAKGHPKKPIPDSLFCKGGRPSLSAALIQVTLYGEDPDRRPDIYGKVGESGVNCLHP